jgi:hypothetical protein
MHSKYRTIGSCEECYFYKPNYCDSGFCLRYPPGPTTCKDTFRESEKISYSTFPEVKPHMWCGEYLRTEDK